MQSFLWTAVEVFMNSIFSRLSDGEAIHTLHARAHKAAENVSETSDPMKVVLADPTADSILPALGFRLLPYYYGYGAKVERLPATWQRPYTYVRFLSNFLRDIHTALLSSVGNVNPDGSITQMLSAETLTAWWKKRCLYDYGSSTDVPDLNHLPIHLAVCLTALGGDSWHIHDDGESLIRTLPNHPLRNHMRDGKPMITELPSKASVDMVCWAALPATLTPSGQFPEVVYFSAVGGHKKLTALWATFMDSKRALVKLPTREWNPLVALGYRIGDMPLYTAARRVEGKGQYRQHWNDAPLETSGLGHLVVEHSTVHRPKVGQPFLHITGEDGIPDLDHFFNQLDIASPLPVRHEWAARLWNEGIKAGLIIKIPASGCAGYWVLAGERTRWGKIVSFCVGVPDADGTIEVFGLNDPDETILMPVVVSEGGDTAHDDDESLD